jgi:hypothetical protein
MPTGIPNRYISDTAGVLPMEVSVMRLMMGVRWFPQTIFNVRRQSGKTRALLNIIHEDHAGRAILVSYSEMQAEFCRHYYLDLFSQTEGCLFVTPYTINKKTIGHESGSWPIYVDEWFLLGTRHQIELMDTNRVVGRVGTERT